MVNIRLKDNKQFYSSLVNIAIPIAVQSIITSSLNLIDNVMIGQLGEAELSAVGMSNQLYFVQCMLLFGFTSGAGAFIAQFWGQRDLKNIHKVLGFSLLFCIVPSLIFFLVCFIFPQKMIHIFSNDINVLKYGKEYLKIVSFAFLFISITIPHIVVLRITEQTKLPMIISSIAFIANTVLNYIFIFGHLGFQPMGVEGAAIATLISRLLEMILILYFIYVKSNFISCKINTLFSFSVVFAKRILNTALPVVTNETMWGLGMASYAVAYGKMGTTEYAAIQVSNTIHSLFILAIFSIGDAALVMIGKELGKKNNEAAYSMSSKLLVLSILLGIIIGIVLIISSPFIVNFFNFTSDGRRYAMIILMIYGSTMWLKVFNGINIIGIFRSGGDTKFAMFTEVLSVWLIGVPIVFWGALVLKLPVYIVVVMAHLEEIVKGIVCFKRYRTKKWINNIINEIE